MSILKPFKIDQKELVFPNVEPMGRFEYSTCPKIFRTTLQFQ
jgi:hypothetical protein